MINFILDCVSYCMWVCPNSWWLKLLLVRYVQVFIVCISIINHNRTTIYTYHILEMGLQNPRWLAWAAANINAEVKGAVILKEKNGDHSKEKILSQKCITKRWAKAYIHTYHLPFLSKTSILHQLRMMDTLAYPCDNFWHNYSQKKHHYCLLHHS